MHLGNILIMTEVHQLHEEPLFVGKYLHFLLVKLLWTKRSSTDIYLNRVSIQLQVLHAQ